jgi:protein SCO1/2
MKRNWVWIAAAVLVGLIALWSVVFTRPYSLRGSELTPAGIAPEINLDQAGGGRYQLSGRTGRPVVIFFGYTNCPDVCPATMAEFKQVRTSLKSQADEADFLLITVDPARDTSEKMATYLKGFDAGVIGLTGTEADLTLVWQSYGVFRQISPGTNADNYSIDHTSRLYVVDKKGNLRVTYPFGTSVADIVSDLRFLLREK